MSGKLKEVKNRITSVTSTQQITKAMKLVAASKLKKATDAIVRMRPYSQGLSNMLSNIVAATEGDVAIELAQKRSEINSALVVVITSDKGLCGGFNTNVIKQARQAVEVKYAQQRKAGKLTILTMGKKGNDFFKRYTDCKLIDAHVNVFKNLSFENASVAINEIMQAYTEQVYDEVMVAYAEFKNPVVQNFHLKQFLPIESAKTSNLLSKKEAGKNNDYLFDPEKNKLINELVPKILKTELYSYLLDSNASEHGARMTAMGNATENAGEMLRELKISYNKERQAAITTELTEIVSGAAALEG